MNCFNQLKEDYIVKINDRLKQILALSGNEYDKVIQAMSYSAMNAGKRIRPILVLEFCKINAGDISIAIDFACAVEMIHCYSLIHDDLPCMDDDDLRRGKPSCHKQFDEATALLAGDALLTKAFEIATMNNEFNENHPDRVVKIVKILSEYAGVHGMIGGQVIDLETEKNGSLEHSVDFELLKKMHSLKTSALIKLSCQMGAIIAGADNDKMILAKEYGENLGLAFQLVDDILDITSTSEKLGKPVGSDEENEKVNFISLCGLDKTKEMAKLYTENAINCLKNQTQNDFLIEMTHNLLKRDY